MGSSVVLITSIYPFHRGSPDHALGNTVAAYGWAAKENDRHILERLLRQKKEAFAVSVHTPTAGDLERHCREIETSIERAAYRMRASKPEVLFFDADSAGSWINI